MKPLPSPQNLEVFGLDPYLEKIRQKLASLSQQHRIAFAAKCCEQLFPWFRALAKELGTNDASVFRQILDRIWKHITELQMHPKEIDELIGCCEAFKLGEENCCDSWNRAVDAAQTLWLTLYGCKSDSAANAAKAASWVINAIDRDITRQLDFLGEHQNLDKSIVMEFRKRFN